MTTHWLLLPHLEKVARGDHLPPMIFNIVVDMLAVLIARAKEDSYAGGLIPHLVEGGISILQYANNKILVMEQNLEKLINMGRVW
jgi:hypothetical protein